jgi:hypothetical protein
MEETDDFDKTLIWSTEEETARAARTGSEVGTFYLVLAAFFLFVGVFFVLYFANRRKKINAIDMMRDPNNVFEDVEDPDDNEEAQDADQEDIPMIDIPEEAQTLDTQAPVTDSMLPVEVK